MFFKPKQPSDEQIQQLTQLYARGEVKTLITEATALLKAFPKSPQICNILSVALYADGDFNDAATFAEKAIALQADYARAYVNLGNAQAALGETDEAAKAYRQAVHIDPDFAEGHNSLGAFLLLQGDTDEASSCFQKAIEINPDYFRAHFNLGCAQMALGQYEPAVASFRRTLELNPAHAGALSHLGSALLELNRHQEALDVLEQLLAIDAEDIGALDNMSRALTGLNRYREAFEVLNHILTLEPDHVDARNNMGCTLLDLSRGEEAIAHFEAVLAHDPRHAMAHNNLAIARLQAGQKQEAIEGFKRAIDIDPTYAEAYSQLADLLDLQPDDPYYRRMLELWASDSTPARQRMHLGFGLARAEARMGERETSFRHLEQANRLRKELYHYSLEEDRAQFERIRSLFSGDRVPVPEAKDTDGHVPVFIVGMPRSGTSLVEQVLSSHSQVFGAGEVPTLELAMRDIAWDESGVDPAGIARLRERYLGWLDSLDVTERFITDKTTLNFRWVGFILQAMPEAKIIHTSRDARATCWSIFQLNFDGDGHGYAYDMDDLSTYYRMYAELMAFWEQRFPGRIHTINYETLTEHQEEETRRLLEYCGLPWEAQCLEFHKSKRAVATASTQQVRKKMYRGSSEAWKQFEDFLQPLTRQLDGY